MPDEPYLPHDINERRLALAFYQRQAEEKREIERRAAAMLDQHGPWLEQEAKRQGLNYQADQRSAAEAVAQIAADQRLKKHQITADIFGPVAEKLHEAREIKQAAMALRVSEEQKAEAERRAIEQTAVEAKTAAARAEPVPGSVQRFGAALEQRQAEKAKLRRGQLERRNNADMDMLAQVRGGGSSNRKPAKKQREMTDAERRKFEQITKGMTRANDERAVALEHKLHPLPGGYSGRTR